jgi:hypothetical protein
MDREDRERSASPAALVCGYCGSADLAPSFIKLRDRRFRPLPPLELSFATDGPLSPLAEPLGRHANHQMLGIARMNGDRARERTNFGWRSLYRHLMGLVAAQGERDRADRYAQRRRKRAGVHSAIEHGLCSVLDREREFEALARLDGAEGPRMGRE